MISVNEFPWDQNDLVKTCYDKANHIIVDTKARPRDDGRKKALIFFSSNGIYYPNNETEFTEKIIKRDYYDWLNIGKHRLIQRYFSRIIYVRDIYKQWYVTGINSRVNSMDKLCDFLKEKTAGYDVTTCGSSSGGYMSALMGSLLNAERIIAASAQFYLLIEGPPGPFVEAIVDDPQKSRYMDIREIVSKSAENLYYFYPARCDKDLMQKALVDDIPIRRFAMDSDKHSRTLIPVCYPYVLTMDRKKLEGLYMRHEGMITDPGLLRREMIPPINRITDPALYNAKRVISYFFR